jgi:hypothetical protein
MEVGARSGGAAWRRGGAAAQRGVDQSLCLLSCWDCVCRT